MKTKARFIEQIVEEQVHRWQISLAEKKEEVTLAPVISISREPGGGGRILAQKIAEKHALDLFHQEVIHEMAASAKVSKVFMQTFDEKGLSVLEHWIASTVHQRQLWPDQYLQHLMKVIGTIGKHGNAVIIGRGANFILPPEGRFRVRVVAPREVRIANVARDYGVSPNEAKRRITRTESERRAFIRKYFNADIADPANYDLVINTETIDIDGAAATVGCAVGLQPGQGA
jgi:cytidylate kinase